MNPHHLSLSPELFAKAFPYHFVFNRNHEILQTGDVLARVGRELLVGSQINQHFQIHRPKIPIDFDAIYKNSRSLFIVEFLDNGMQMKGQMMYEQEQEIIFFLGSPWINDISSLAPLGLKLKDFAIHDQITDFLFLLQAQNTALSESKKLMAELNQQKLQLQSTLSIKDSLAKVAKAQSRKLKKSLKELQATQTQLIQAEKMSSLGLLVAGVAHEINNPVSFIQGNLTHYDQYTQDLLKLLELYQEFYPEPGDVIENYIDTIDLDFLLADLPKIVSSMKSGVKRIADIVLSLRNFSRIDEAEVKLVDIHEGLDSTLLILKHRFNEGNNNIELVKKYGDLPLIECYPGKLNQVFMNIISNAIDALKIHNTENDKFECSSEPGKITITTEMVDKNWVVIRIADNGQGMTDAVKKRLFDPFFTTKPIGKGTGLGLSISYQIVVERHKGKLNVFSELGQGSEFWIEIPISVNGK